MTPSDQAMIDALRAELNSRNAALVELAETHEFRMRQWADEVTRLKDAHSKACINYEHAAKERDEYRAKYYALRG